MAEAIESLDEWAHDRIITVTLPPALGHPEREVTYEVPDLEFYIAQGLIPDALSSLAVRIVTGVLDEEKLEPEQAKAYFELRCWTIAKHLRSPDIIAQLGSHEAAAEWVATKMHPDHRAKLWSVSVHVFDAEQLLKSVIDASPFRLELGEQELPDGGREDASETG